MLNKNVLITVILFIFISVTSVAQMRYQQDKSRNENSWFVGVNTGLTSYFGSVAVYNRDLLLKFQKESKFAFGAVAGKSFNRFLGARLYYLRGGFKLQNNELQFLYNAKLSSYGGQFLIQFATLFGGMDYVPDYAFYGIAGAGLMNVKPELSTIPSEKEPESIPIDSLNYASQVSTIGINIGIGGSYQILNQVDINAEVTYHYSFSEELDLTSGGGKDKFLYLSIGAIYRFGFQGQSRRSGFNRRRR